MSYQTSNETTTNTKKKPTLEQQNCCGLVKDHDFVKIEAVSGSGKTTTLQYISETLGLPSLYLAYNKSMAEEAKSKFPKNVETRTTHSLAYSIYGSGLAHKLKRPVGRYVNVAGTASEIAKFYKISFIQVDEDEIITEAFLGLIVKDSVAKFEQSADNTFNIDAHIPSFHKKDIEKRFGSIALGNVKRTVAKVAKKLWQDRISPLSPVLATHDTYLKLYQLSKPDLSKNYKLLLLDEAQDTNDCVLDIVLSQKDRMKVVLVGDSRQQIYAWRGAVNAMNKVNAEKGTLSKSFRYGEPIAAIARSVLQHKVKIEGNEKVKSTVALLKAVDFEKPYTILFRKNTTLVFRAIELISQGVKVSINIDVRDFVEMLSSAHALYLGEMNRVKHENILPYSSWEDFTNEAKSAPDLSKLITIILSGDAQQVISTLHTYKKDPNAIVTLTTAHKAKGLEYAQVVLADDFPSVYNTKGEYEGLSEEEENLLYVACTRAKFALNVNETIFQILNMQNKGDVGNYLSDYKASSRVKLPNKINLNRELGHFDGEDYVFK